MNARVSIPQGELVATIEQDVLAFYSIPYGEHTERFKSVGPPPVWEGVRDATTPGPVFPQVKNRLSAVMGTVEEEKNQDENAYTLNIWTKDPQGKLPVIFWVPGGGFLTGGASLSWYHASQLAASGKVVMVTVNYRLGALGNLFLPGLAEGNMAFKDLLAALAWVKENISSFGGDPNCVTLAGQSVGAWYVAALLAYGTLPVRVENACLFSMVGTVKPTNQEEASKLGEQMCRELHIDLTGEDLKHMPIDQLLQGQQKAMQVLTRIEKRNFSFGPVIDDRYISSDVLSGAVQKSGGMINLLIGTTRDEAAAFYPDKGIHEYETIRKLTKKMFTEPTHCLAERMAQAGSKTYVYQFNYASQDPSIRSCHCYDLPFLFGNFNEWANAPMLSKGHLQNMEQVSRIYQDYVLKTYNECIAFTQTFYHMIL